jgi:uncharacterized protein (DUF1800 family)
MSSEPMSEVCAGSAGSGREVSATPGISRRGLLRGAAGAGAAAALLRSWPAEALEARTAARRLPVGELKGIVSRVAQPVDPVVHLLHRTTYGVPPGEVDRARQMGLEAWLDEQLHPETIDDSALDAGVAAMFPTLTQTAQELYDIAEQQNDGGYSVAMELKRATIYRALLSRKQLFEMMVEFWNNHFSMYHFKDDVAVLKTVDDREVARTHALGTFHDLLAASGHSPAMMVFLDNADNVAGGPNENYGRELMELHTIGVDAGYTQQDVHEVARCFTGWTVDYNDQGTNGDFLFDPDSHDPGPKVVLGNAIAGGDPGIADGQRVLAILARHPSCATFIGTKLCRHFVADDPPASVVAKAAATFTATGGDIRSVLKTILLSDELFASAGQKLRRPYEFVLAALRTLGPQPTSDGLDNLIWSLYPLGQVPFEWVPPNGYPDVGAAWANTNGMLNRWNVAAALVLNWFDGVPVPLLGIVAAAAAKTPARFVDAMGSRFLQGPLGAADRALLIDYVGQGRAGNARVPPWYLNQQAAGAIALILGSPYFQWR